MSLGDPAEVWQKEFCESDPRYQSGLEYGEAPGSSVRVAVVEDGYTPCFEATPRRYSLTRARYTAYLSGVFSVIRNLRMIGAMLCLVAMSGLTGCVHLPPPASAAEINLLRSALIALHSDIQEEDASRLATAAYDYPRQLAGEYRLVRPPLFHNLLINVGLKKRGLCYQWAEDMVAQLQTLHLDSLEFYWGTARPGTLREHNTIIVTGRGQPFVEGIVLDPWRRSGQLVWISVVADTYVWQEGELFVQ